MHGAQVTSHCKQNSVPRGAGHPRAPPLSGRPTLITYLSSCAGHMHETPPARRRVVGGALCDGKLCVPGAVVKATSATHSLTSSSDAGLYSLTHVEPSSETFSPHTQLPAAQDQVQQCSAFVGHVRCQSECSAVRVMTAIIRKAIVTPLRSTIITICRRHFSCSLHHQAAFLACSPRENRSHPTPLLTSFTHHIGSEHLATVDN